MTIITYRYKKKKVMLMVCMKTHKTYQVDWQLSNILVIDKKVILMITLNENTEHEQTC